jgi:4-amino-4-deoxy-L-arabinose transferase-like glycosyltransferase
MSKSLPMQRLFSGRPFAAALAFLVIHVIVWTGYGVLSNEGSLHPDMLEAYLWGHEYQLGYFKHPPLWAWLAGAWFEVFPRANWAFYLLSSLNSGLALIGVWRLYGLYAKDGDRLAATLLLLVTPFYTFMALKFNANSMLLSLWPWTVFFFARSIEQTSIRAAFYFGVLAAAGLLSKYYSVILLASCAVASFYHPNWRKYYLSPAPYIAAITCVVLIIPHIYWLVTNDFQTVEYAKSRGAFPAATIYRSVVAFFFGCAGLNALLAGFIWWSRRGQPSGTGPVLIDPSRQRFLSVLALGPFVLTLLAGVIGQIRLSTNFAVPIFFLLPLFLIQVLKPETELLKRLAVGAAGLLYVLAVPVALAVPFIMFKVNKPSRMPAMEVAQDATRLFHEVAQAPLLNVAGSFPYALVTAYYSGDETKEFTNFDSKLAPWVTQQRLSKTGLLAICLQSDGHCNERASSYYSPRSQKFEMIKARRYGASTAEPERFWLHVIPPS